MLQKLGRIKSVELFNLNSSKKYIELTQSLNLSFDPNDSPKWINQCHIEAWKLGIKTLYYLRTDSVIKGDLGSRMADCVSCDG